MDAELDYTLLYRVAKAYYEDNLTQQEIADVENFSRPQISRLLKKVTEERLVTYQLNFPARIEEQDAAQRLCALLGLEQAVLIPSFYGGQRSVTPEKISNNLALGVAGKLEGLLGDARNVGLGWGRTLYNTALHIRAPQHAVRGRMFLPLIGLSGDRNPALQINTIVDRFGERYHAERHYVNLCSFRTEEILSDYDRSIVELLHEKWAKVDAAIIGIGGPPAENPTLISEFPRRYKKQIYASGSVGDILSQFFCEDGRVLEPDESCQLLAMKLEQLRGVPRVIAVAAGPEKCAAIRTAARLGYFKTLVTDYDTAALLIEEEKENRT